MQGLSVAAWKALEELKLMRDKGVYNPDNLKAFNELVRAGVAYRRVGTNKQGERVYTYYYETRDEFNHNLAVAKRQLAQWTKSVKGK